MFDIGWSELLLIGIAALFVVDPKQLPDAWRQAGRWLRSAMPRKQPPILAPRVNKRRRSLLTGIPTSLHRQFALGELGQRLGPAGVAFFVAFLACFLTAEDVYAFLAQPLIDAWGHDPGRRMIFTQLAEVFFTYVKIAVFAAFFITFPVIAVQLWKFVAPGLGRAGKLRPFLIATPVMFFLGAALCYYVIFPLPWQFFLGFERPATEGTVPIQLGARVADYLSLVTKLLFAFGLAFQLPVALTLLGRAGVVDAAGLAARRSRAYLGLLVLAAVATPPDVISMLGLAIPLFALYELSIVMIRGLERLPGWR